ncbi:hypothetical protein [Cryobacterium glucosi]|uniref:Uncharacterized protein n=1 Tax=Cryobacterium glucosi TaxID=1259175 RepID=A0ABY2IIN5_9MICO|nr:hypothetical protein [Cryobacterium glucosi]TFC17327.1 hypothetical protein E3O46_16975 [Cryobacterium glucosi]
MTRPGTRRAVGLIVTLALGLAIGLPTDSGAGSRAEARAAQNAATALVLQVAPTAPAGAEIPVTVAGAADGATVQLVAIGSLGQLVLTAVSVDDTAEFRLPVALTRSAGSVTLVASSGGTVVRGATELTPGAAVGPIQAVVGARSIVADAADLSMVVTIPVDAWGNSIAEGSPVLVSRENPVGVRSSSGAVVSHLLAFQELVSGTLAGRGQVWVASGPVTGPSVSLDEVAGPPLPFSLEPVEPVLAANAGADGQTLVPIRTSVLRDRFGNVEPDGTQVTVEWTGPEGAGRTTAATISGVAQLSLQAPGTPGAFQITGLCRGVHSASALTLPFAATVGTVDLSARLVDAGVFVSIGPVNRFGGTFVPDGTTARVSVVDAIGEAGSASAGLVNGVLDILVATRPLVSPVTVTVSVLGAENVETLR